jgi:hypothetical protein
LKNLSLPLTLSESGISSSLTDALIFCVEEKKKRKKKKIIYSIST